MCSLHWALTARLSPQRFPLENISSSKCTCTGATELGLDPSINLMESKLNWRFILYSRMTTEGTTSQNGYGVIGVYAEVSETAPVSGFWATLNASKVPNSGDNFTVSNFMLSSVLPPNLNPSDYYYYAGGLTTPPCTEAVQFFLLKQRIQVPAAYLTYLRSTRSDEGDPLDFNYRNLQELNCRVVEIPGSSAVAASASLMLVAAVALLAITGLTY